MKKKPVKKQRLPDPNVTAFTIVQQLSGDAPVEPPTDGKNPAAVALGKLGGAKGGPARAAKLSPAKRKAIAKKAAAAGWGKKLA